MTKKSIFLSYLIIAITIISCSQNKVYYDIPSLIGKNIDQAREVLKNQEDKEKPFIKSFSDQQDYYEINGRTLLINFNPKTRKVTQISLVYPKGYRNKSDILKIGNLQENAAHYKCEISTDDWSLSPFTCYNGVRIVPKH